MYPTVYDLKAASGAFVAACYDPRARIDPPAMEYIYRGLEAAKPWLQERELMSRQTLSEEQIRVARREWRLLRETLRISRMPTEEEIIVALAPHLQYESVAPAPVEGEAEPDVEHKPDHEEPCPGCDQNEQRALRVEAELAEWMLVAFESRDQDSNNSRKDRMERMTAALRICREQDGAEVERLRTHRRNPTSSTTSS